MRYDLPVAFKEFEVVTTTDKDQRDRLFEDLRKNGNALERQVVKFSGNQPVMKDGGQVMKFRFYPGKNPRVQPRPVFESTWSIAYPAS